MTYSDVRNLIKAALSLRPAGTKVQVEDHETAEIAILDYVEQVKSEAVGVGVRSSSIDAGEFGQISIIDDYIFFCVKTGGPGQAIWKKAIIFNSI